MQALQRVNSVDHVPGLGYSQEHVTAAVSNTLQFIGLLTFYLGVKLPFDTIWSGGAPGMGFPSIVAGRGPERGGWAK